MNFAYLTKLSANKIIFLMFHFMRIKSNTFRRCLKRHEQIKEGLSISCCVSLKFQQLLCVSRNRGIPDPAPIVHPCSGKCCMRGGNTGAGMALSKIMASLFSWVNIPVNAEVARDIRSGFVGRNDIMTSGGNVPVSCQCLLRVASLGQLWQLLDLW